MGKKEEAQKQGDEALKQIKSDFSGEFGSSGFGDSGASEAHCEKSKEFGTHSQVNTFDMSDDKGTDIPSLKISSITIRSGAVANGIVVKYEGGPTVKYGESTGSSEEFSLKGDGIKKITGQYDVKFSGGKVISQLRFETVKGKKYGPFGFFEGGENFTISDSKSELTAFFGSSDGRYLTSFGAYLVSR